MPRLHPFPPLPPGVYRTFDDLLKERPHPYFVPYENVTPVRLDELSRHPRIHRVWIQSGNVTLSDGNRPFCCSPSLIFRRDIPPGEYTVGQLFDLEIEGVLRAPPRLVELTGDLPLVEVVPGYAGQPDTILCRRVRYTLKTKLTAT